jgi:hypothetical protein
MPNRNPYTPGFGLSPPTLAGRAGVIDETLAALRAGPRHPRFCFALLGHRGVGKTSVLDAIGERATSELGWPVVHRQAMREGDLLGDVGEGLIPALGHWNRLGRDYRHLEKDLSVGFNLGVVSAKANVHSTATAEGSGPGAFVELLRKVGTFARDHDSGVLITIDEAMTARRPDLVGMAGAIQTVVNRSQLPIAVIFAGLPSFREAIGVAGTFAERLSVQNLADLSPDASRLALVEPAAQLGVRWAPEALDLVTARSAGHPYYVQLFGYHSWEAGGGAEELTVAHVEAGIRVTETDLHGQFEGTWGRLRPQEQSFLSAVAVIGGSEPVPIVAVAASLKRSTGQLDVARNRLVYQHGLLRSPGRGQVQFHSHQFGDWVSENHAVVASPIRPNTSQQAQNIKAIRARPQPGRGFER